MTSKNKPKYRKVKDENIPNYLKNINQWVLWRGTFNNGKWTKPPFQPNGNMANTKDRNTWNAFYTVFNAYKSGNWDGVGIVLTPELSLVGFDFDHCAEDEKINSDEVQEFISTLASYTELSPTDGLRIMVRGEKTGKSCKHKGYELYDSGRYLTITGHTLNENDVEQNQEGIDTVYDKIFPQKKELCQTNDNIDMTDQQVLDALLRDEKANRLYSGDISEYPSPSEAVAALCLKLAFYCGKDESMMDRLFRDSALMSEKWDSQRGNTTLGANEIKNAIALQKDVYSPGQQFGDSVDEQQIKSNCEKILKRREQVGEFNPEHLPTVIKNYLHDLSQESSADPVMILQSILCMISSMIGKRVYIPENTGYFQKLYANLWCLTINESGGFKTTSLNKGSRIAFATKRETEKKIKEIQKEKNTDKDKNLTDFNEEKQQRIDDLRKTIPVLPDRYTTEGLMTLFQRSGYAVHMGGQVICSEFSEWLANMGKSHNSGLKPFLTNLYDVPELYEYLTKNSGHMFLDSPYLCINAVSTLEWLRKDIQNT